MPKEIYIDSEKFDLGLYALQDTTKSPFGSARTMKNMQITLRGGVAPRPGIELLGDNNSSSSNGKSLYNFRKSYDSDEFLIKTYDDEVEVYSKNHSGVGWFRLKNNFTTDKDFGFVTSLVNTLSEDYCVFCNRYEDYQRWSGAVTVLNGVLAGAETAVVVDSVLTDEIFESKTASASAATTLDISPAAWAASQWVGMYVYITSGANIGKIRLISANTSTQITFATLGSDPGACTFQIRKAAFPATGTIIYNGTNIDYTAIPTATSFTVASAHASADNVAVALVPTVYPANPRGNRMTNYLGRVIVGNVRSALARDSGGTLSGFASAGSYFVSKILNPFDFGFTATRVAGEGDIIATPYGGGDITDVAHQEDTAYVFKKRYIEAVQYSQDSSDLANRTPLKAEIGSIGPIIKGANDIFFVTDDNVLTSIGREKLKDVKPSTKDLGGNIQRLLDGYVFGDGRGIQDGPYLYIPARSSEDVVDNDILIVINAEEETCEGIWELAVSGLAKFDGELHLLESNSPNVYKMNVGHSDVNGDDRFPISAEYNSHFMNLTPSKANIQGLSSIYFEGYIKGGTTITFKAFKDLITDTFLEFEFMGTETDFLDGADLSAALGNNPMGLQPIGSISSADEEGRRHFMFRVYFPFVYGNFFSVGWSSEGSDDDYEITRYGLGLKESVSVDNSRIKSIA